MSNVIHLTPHNPRLDWSVGGAGDSFADVSGGYYAAHEVDGLWMARFQPRGDYGITLGYRAFQWEAEELCQAHYAHTFAHLIAAWRTRRAG